MRVADGRGAADVEELRPSLTPSSISVLVASPGPPPVVTKMMSNTRNASIMRKVSARKIDGSISGRMIERRR